MIRSLERLCDGSEKRRSGPAQGSEEKNAYVPNIKTAFSHDWLNGMRGGEKCLEALCEVYPNSRIYTLFYQRGRLSERLASLPITESWLGKIPGIYAHYRHWLPFYSAAVRSLKLGQGLDLVISTHHCAAKGIRKPEGALHVCYCFTPVRYAWGFFEEYFGRKDPLQRSLIRFCIDRFRRWDLKSAGGVDHFIAISEHVRKRIQACYGRDAEVIYPPVDTSFYVNDARAPREDFYLMVSALVPYKRVDLAVEAFNKMDKPLRVIGDGPERQRLEALAGPNVRFIGWRTDEELREHYCRARALIFPGEEDFGIVPVEMQACGGPVIAYRKGGAVETVTEDQTGVFFNEQTAEALIQAVSRFEKRSWDPGAAVVNAVRFDKRRFQELFKSAVERLMKTKAMPQT